jgi:hypothetical protein
MSHISIPAPEPGATAETYPQIKKAVGKVPTRAVFALAALLIATACAASPIKTPASARADEVTAERVNSALKADPIHFYRHVDVRVDDGVAQLSGYVWGTESLYDAQRVASRVSGVRAVINQLHLKREEGLSDGG